MTSPAASLVDQDDVRREVDSLLAEHVAGLRAELSAHGQDVTPVVEAVAGMLGGGKRMRAALCYWSWRAHGGPPDPSGPARPAGAPPRHAATRDQVLRVGSALELFQAAALFHDDVMDDSDLRRGRPAAHRAFAELHTSRQWSGSPRRFGEAAAILLGDLALIASERELARAVAGLAEPTATRVRGVFDAMRTEVTVGQYLDVLAQAQPWGSDHLADEERARSVIRTKSARYSVEHPIALGAALAGADDDALARCSRIGLPLGEAFQLRDDLLGVFGDPSATGKPAGDDLREGKRTVLVARALQGASTEDRALITDSLGRRDLTAEDVARLREVLRASGAVGQVEALIDQLAAPALTELEQLDLDRTGRAMLADLGRALVDRHA